MPIWKLMPYDTAHPHWDASAHKDIALVRAPDEKTARATAAKAFRIAPDRPAGESPAKPRVCPWERREHVKAELTRDPRWPTEGPVAVLDPPHSGNAFATRLEQVD